MQATVMLRQQHRRVKALFRELKYARAAGRRRDLLDQIARALHAHMEVEEEIFYPAVRAEAKAKRVREELVPEAYEEHHVVQLLLAETSDLDVEDERFEAKMSVFAELVAQHIEAEEDSLLAAAEKLGRARLTELAEAMRERMAMRHPTAPPRTRANGP